MGEEEARLRLFELLWQHPSKARTTAELAAVIDRELLPWITGSQTPWQLWPELLEDYPPPPNTGKGEGV